MRNKVRCDSQYQLIPNYEGNALVSDKDSHDSAPEWLSGMITGCEFPDAQRLSASTLRYLELSVKEHIAKNKAVPRSIAVHPVYLDELLEALELPQAERSLLHGIGVLVDQRCVVPCLVDERGQFHEL
jgi:hypothetical protein